MGQNTTRWYTTREILKASINIEGATLNRRLDQLAEGASEEVEELLGRRFIPYTGSRRFDWPPRVRSRYAWILELDEDLLSLTSITDEGDDAVAIAAGDVNLEPYNAPASGYPYDRIEIDLQTSATFDSGDTPQQAIRVTGQWGYTNRTRAAGDLAAAIATAAATSAQVTDGSLVEVGNTLLVNSEAIFVSDKEVVDSTRNLAADLASSEAARTVQVDSSTGLNVGEVLLIDSERMLIEDISGNNLTVRRKYDGSTLASHSNGADVYVYRLLTIVRGVNGTTAATHAQGDDVLVYAPPQDIVDLATAIALARHANQRSGWTGQMGGGESSIEVRGISLRQFRADMRKLYRRGFGFA